MRLRIVTAGVGIQWESALVQACQDGAARAAVVQRCYDVGDLLAVAASGKAEVALIASTMRWLDRDSVVRLESAGLAVVGVVPAGDDDAERRLRQLGIIHVAQGNAQPATLIAYARAAIAGLAEQRPDRPVGADAGQHRPGAQATKDARPWPVANSAETSSQVDAAEGSDPSLAIRAASAPSETAVPADSNAGAQPETEQPGHVLVAVWGPKGAPGRTTIAVNLAFEALPIAGETLLVDADTYGGSISQTLGFLDEHPGLAWAARLSSRGALDGPKLWQATQRAGPGGPRVLSGLPRADLWTEVRPGTWQSLLELFRVGFEITVIDLGFCLEEEEELLYDHVRFRRNAVTRIALQQADLVVAVARADPVGLHDFIRGYQQLRDLGIDPRSIRVVVNQVRGGLFGGDAVPQIRAALGRYLGVEPSVFVPYDRSAMDSAVMVGKALREVRQGSAVQLAMATLAASVIGGPAEVPSRRRLRGRRTNRRRRVRWNGQPSGPTMTSRNLGW
jgi:MinD-like ATPase involved in chromosome partitioning or flagellar assembly